MKVRFSDEADDLFSKRKIWNLIVPLISECVLLSMMGIADTLMVANAGEAAVSAVSLINQFNNVMVQFFSALSVGGSVLISQLVGAKEHHEARQCARQLMQSILLFSLLIGIICVALRAPLISLFYPDIESDVLAGCHTYLFVTAISYPFLAVGSAASSIFRINGDSKTPMYVNILANLINVGGNAWLIFEMKLGVLGAALPTLASRIFAAVVMAMLLTRKNSNLYVRHWMFVKPNFSRIGKMMRIAIPTGIENGGFELGKLVISSALSSMGTVALAANALEITMENMSSQIGAGINNGAMILVGTCVGARRFDEAKRKVSYLCFLNTIGIILFCLFNMAIARPIASFSGLGEEAMTLFLQMNTFVHIVKVFPYNCFTYSAALKGAGDVRFTMIVSQAVMWGVRVLVAVVLVRFTDLGVMSMWISMASDWYVRCIVFKLRFRSGKWMEKSILGVRA